MNNPRGRRLFMIVRLAVATMILAVATPAAALRAQQLRGAWVTAWAPGHRTPQELEATFEAAQQAGLNALFVQVRKVADAYYRSDLEPRGDGIAPDFDPLAAAIEKARANKIELHAWINCLRVWRAKEPPTDPNHIVNRRPEWLNKRYDGVQYAAEGIFLDPGIPEVREYTASVVEEIARKYPVYGIHLDYIRYPGKDWGYSELALRHYREDTGARGISKPHDPKWLAWRRERVTKLVELIRKRVRAVRPSAKLTAATISWSDCPTDFRQSAAYTTVLQDWKMWLTRGLLDANAPMNYKRESNPAGAKSFRAWLAGYKKWSSGRPVFVGIDADTNPVSDVVKQVEAVRKAGLAGFLIFPFNDSAKRAALASALKVKSGDKNK